MKDRTAELRAESSHDQSVISKERLDEWLDAALADTFPASDPVASPPSTDTLAKDERSATYSDRGPVQPSRGSRWP